MPAAMSWQASDVGHGTLDIGQTTSISFAFLLVDPMIHFLDLGQFAMLIERGSFCGFTCGPTCGYTVQEVFSFYGVQRC